MGYVGINKLSLLDFPNKIACIVFTNACNFRCPFCHNGLTLLDNTDELTFDEVLCFLKSRVGKLDGVVITGGEPTLQKSLIEDIKQIKSLGFAVKLDTNGTNPEIIDALINNNLVDYIAMDIKNSLALYETTTGVKNVNKDNIKKSISILMKNKVPYEFRTTLVNEFHNLNSISEMGEILNGAEKLFLQKYVLSDGVINKNLHPVSEDLAKQFRTILDKYVSQVELRGY